VGSSLTLTRVCMARLLTVYCSSAESDPTVAGDAAVCVLVYKICREVAPHKSVKLRKCADPITGRIPLYFPLDSRLGVSTDEIDEVLRSLERAQG